MSSAPVKPASNKPLHLRPYNKVTDESLIDKKSQVFQYFHADSSSTTVPTAADVLADIEVQFEALNKNPQNKSDSDKVMLQAVCLLNALDNLKLNDSNLANDFHSLRDKIQNFSFKIARPLAAVADFTHTSRAQPKKINQLAAADVVPFNNEDNQSKSASIINANKTSHTNVSNEINITPVQPYSRPQSSFSSDDDECKYNHQLRRMSNTPPSNINNNVSEEYEHKMQYASNNKKITLETVDSEREKKEDILREVARIRAIPSPE